ncbi:tRNA (N(6)-L-threonylcarbamoyladenosine(37)-C(2))-methylthiotransferase MtaB [Sphingomonas jatrophae]|uniref:Threonylcarbamoyladenosine tRNA methylthiotransferase MtaB n=1 Tax=Sphingomonas jatrophae TaxID=1166337 RepID=A0A1I6JYG4_9SPHN|nr:tRNA (N(6)-L-threonylcarbamoyladenosine(37)-C(2))-methylthiotransferase MtaB [Sphingomonas jatrophae]SFR84019.1 threonylcarbamoyladenosine tRNA methylthiotransferase MtaB [Sphingomonas jatrophae]
MSGPELLTFGCRLNLAESEAMRVAAADQDDLVIVNSCAVTAEAARQAAQAIRRAHRRRPDARIVVTGCAAQVEPGRFAAMAEVSAVVGNADKHDPAAFRAYAPRVRVSDVMQVARLAPQLVEAFAEHARAFIEVQNGCDHACTFCVIPQGRGPSRSLPLAHVVEQVARAAAAGHREAVLTGVDLTSWAEDGMRLGHLCAAILARTSIQRLRLGSLDPVEVDDGLFDLLANEPRMMPHVHLALQHGADLILKRMKRRHLAAQAIRLVERLKAQRDIAVGADLIAGFPTETAEHHAANLALLDSCDVTFAHIFPYSPRPATPAARMPQLDGATIKARAAALRTRAAIRKAAWLDRQIGTVAHVLIERDGLTGHAANFARVRLPAATAANTLLPLRIVARDGDTLLGTPA